MITDFWPHYLQVSKNLTYLGNKCRYEQWGESIVKERFPQWLEKIYDFDERTLEMIIP